MKLSRWILFLGMSLVLPLASSNAQAAIVLKASTPANQDGFAYKAFVDMGKFIAEKTNGKYQLDVYDSAKLGNPDTVNQGIQFGTIHFAQDGTGNMSAFTPMASVFEMPFVFTSLEDFRKVFSGPMAKEIAEKLSTKTIRYIAFSECDFRKMYTRQPTNTLKELQTRRIRTTLSKQHNDAVRALGINPTPMPVMEVFTSIQQGVIDGLDIDLVWGLISNFNEVAPYIYESDHLFTPQVLVTGQRWWNSLPKEDRSIMEQAAALWSERASYYYNEDAKEARNVMLSKGVKFTVPSDADKAEMHKLVEPLYAKMPPEQLALLKAVKAEIAKTN